MNSWLFVVVWQLSPVFYHLATIKYSKIVYKKHTLRYNVAVKNQNI